MCQIIINISNAYDIMLLASLVKALRKLVCLCETYARENGLINPNKTEVVVFKARKHRPALKLPIVLERCVLKVLEKF